MLTPPCSLHRVLPVRGCFLHGTAGLVLVKQSLISFGLESFVMIMAFALIAEVAQLFLSPWKNGSLIFARVEGTGP